MHGDRKPHIVHISNRTMPGGAQMSTLRLIQSSELSGFRHSVVCVINATHGPLEERYMAAGAAVVYCPIPPVRLRPYRLWRRVSRALFALRLLRVLRALQPDAVHSQTPAGLDVQGRTVRALGLPWVVSVRMLLQGAGRCWPAVQHLAQQGPTAVVAVSEAVRESLKRSGFTHPVRVIYNGIDLRPYLECSGGCRPPRRNSGVSENSIVFGTCARVEYVKGIDVLVEAAHLLVSRGADVHFVVAGDGSDRTLVETRARTLGVGARFRILGWVLDVPAFLAGLDVFVFPSRSEGFPSALVEALAAGLPCIASNVGGIPEILGEDGGILVPPDDPEALAEAMQRMLDPDVRRHYAEKAPAIAQKFSIERCAQQYAEVYEELLDSSASGCRGARASRHAPV